MFNEENTVEQMARKNVKCRVRMAGIMTLPDVIRRIKRHASQTGQAYLAVEDFSG